ncbi:hypothetical protein [Clostridium manihotivorum]|uniref:DUF4878 domain-containing protein n=1 Tax=Clostridium manihotivorum TaxID=2320868 RepID=A0A3R5TJT4_9CLOT|nr:hypothetical protein [Clostridium manihotivorum]QAA35101.1 hypothetical protein C1I91_27585 [Clostridium manihotivorum]
MNLYERLKISRSIVISILMLTSIMALVYPILKKSQKETLQYKTEKFFNDIINEQYDEAFKFVDYKENSKQDLVEAKENKKIKWISRLRRQRANGVRIEACTKVKIDNTEYPVGTVRLIVNKKGILEEYIIGVTYVRINDGYKIRNISKIDDSIQEEICGRIVETY